MASTLSHVNGHVSSRASELDDLLKAVHSLIISFVRSSEDPTSKPIFLVPDEEKNQHPPRLIPPSPGKLQSLMNFELPANGQGKVGLISAVEKVLKFSVNTWDQRYLDKLASCTNPVGVISELILAVLNTNVHVFKVSPALTIIEKTTTKSLANLFGFDGPYAGGISTQGGSASNLTSVIVARNILFPASKKDGNASKKFVLFTSCQGHYSLEKAALMCGFGTDNVWPIPSDENGRMIPSELEKQIELAKAENLTPFYVNATAGTTVLGAYDPFIEISAICKKNNLWMHVDASWGGPVIFSQKYRNKLAGANLADSLGTNPQKMLGAPVTCSLLLTQDIRNFHKANSLPADYLFHSCCPGEEIWDLADLTLQCSRRADSLKLALSWIYYGNDGFERQIDHAFSIAAQFATLISDNPAFVLVSENPPPCLQVCFYYIGEFEFRQETKYNNRLTSEIVEALIPQGFLVDYATGKFGSFLRVVVNRETKISTVSNLIKAIEKVGSQILQEFSKP